MSEKEEVTFEIVKHIGTISTYPTGWSKECNLVKWNEGTPKIDIRDWDSSHERMSRGVTFHKEEANKLLDLLKDHLRSKGVER